jgi:hypothetical protein
MRRMLWLALLAIGCAWVPPALVALSQPVQRESTPSAAQGKPVSSKIWVGRYEAFEEFLRTADIERTTNVSTGVLGIRRAYFKPDGLAASAALRSTRPGKYNGYWESYKGDIAAYKLDRLLQLDMVPPTVERRYDAELVSVQVWSEDTRMLKEIQAQNLRPSNLEPYNFQLRRQKVFQNLVGNPDPNQGNILFDPAWNIILIDFSRAFTNTQKLVFAATAIDREFLDRIKALDRDTLRREIGEFVEPTAVDALLARRDDIVKAFEKLAKQKGAGQVILPSAP